MKTIQNQTLWGTIISFIGIFIGTINQGILIPKYLETDQLGLISILLSYSGILAIISPLGFNNAGSKYFPKFENEKNGHNGYLFLGLIFILLGLIISSIILVFFEKYMVASNEGSNLFNHYFNYLFPLLIFTSLFNFFDNYAKNLRYTVFGIFLGQLFNRLGTFLATILILLRLIDFHQFLILWMFVQCLPSLIMFFYILRIPGFSLLPQKFFGDSPFKKEFFRFAAWSLLTGIGTVAIFKLDSILVYRYLGLAQIGVYNFCLLFGSVMAVSYTINVKTSTSFVIKSIQNHDWVKVQRMYQKSSITQSIFGFLLLILAFSNLDVLFSLINKSEFNVATWAVLIVGFAKLVDLGTGINSLILLYSDYYRWDILLNGIFLIFIILFNSLLIPRFGINGAALALLFANLVYNLMRVGLLYKKLNIQPFKFALLEVIILGLILLFVGYQLPNYTSNLLEKMLTVTYKSIFLGGVFSIIVIKRNYSEDFNEIYSKMVSYLRSFLKAK